MTPQEAFEDIKKQILPDTPLTDALTKFVQFYASTSIDGCPKESEGDMLLFEWGGPYSWDRYVSLSLTRQFSHSDEAGEYERLQQLHMHCRYNASEVTLDSGSAWLHGQDTDAFLQYILNAPCTAAVNNLRMQALDFDLHDV